ncbi:permease (plasmid) [Gemmatirosa kalamazoonensis]|uniref:Permease n=1 Tax=Gemmatirosa kalamazoonensis TaxID=861299 RepID=W0RVZ3_9BACT|nr:ABC transporter permease [Gemmatirosa kalamazoonensis]AHG93723.1 permease [Gemmatirosa kalamazoonensis]
MKRAFRLPASRRRLDAELDAELAFHLEGRVEDLMAREGLSRAAAESEARRRFGDLDVYRRETSAIDHHTHTRRRGMELLGDVRRETRTAIRALRRAPTFAVVAFATLALGIGAATAIFTLLDRIVIRPLPYPRAERLLHLGTSWPGVKPGEEYGISTYMYHRFRQGARTLEELGLFQPDVYTLPAANGLDAERVLGVDASASLFHVLGIRPALGRLFTVEEQLPNDAGVVVISHGLWQRRFGGERSVIGRAVDVGGRLVRVIGVLPPGAKLPESEAEIWEPLHLDPADPPRNHHTFHAIGLARDGVPVERARAELDALTHRIVADFPNVYGEKFLARTGFGFVLRSLRDEVVGPKAARVLWILFASVGLVLVIAAANVANLVLVRVEARRRDVAVRTALGGGRWQLATHFLSESFVLAIAAAVGAIALAWTLLHVVLLFAPTSLPRLEEVRLDGRGVAFCAAVALAAGAVFGLMPLPRSGGGLDVAVLREGGRGATTSRAGQAARRALVVTQIALAVVLLAAAGLMLESFQRLRAVRPGFDARGVLAMSIALRGDRYRTDAQVVAFWQELSRRVAALPGVTGMGATSMLPLDGDAGCTGVAANDSPLDEAHRSACVPTLTVAPGYFATLGIPVRGEAPGWTDNEQGSGTMVVSRALGERLWPGQSPIGKSLVYSMRRPLVFRVTGVAEDVRANGLQKPPIEAAYFPLAAPAAAGPAKGGGHDLDGNFLHFVVRSNAEDLQRLGAAVRRVMADIDPQVPVADVTPMETIVARSVAQTSFTMLLLALSSAIALVLSAAGTYGVMSYLVARRRAEIGVRVALGAPAGAVGRMVVLQSVRMAVAGAVVGLLAAIAGTRLLGALLFEVSPTDPVVLTVVPLVLVGIAAAAAFAPARRATRVDPVTALRGD